MKRILLLLMVMLLASVLPAIGALTNFDDAHVKVVQTLRAPEEADALDAMWDGEDLLKVGVVDHGKDYQDFAQHVCKIVTEAGVTTPDVQVKVIDLKQLLEQERWTVLGEAICRQ